MKDRHIVIISGSRAEWGLLQPVTRELLQLQNRVSIIATASHLHSQSGFSISEFNELQGAELIEAAITPEDADASDENLMLLTMSNAFKVLPDKLKHLNPDLVLVLGDRYEIFAAASVCRLIGIRIAHISGGEVTIGAVDDCLRHCISKLSDLHFTATETYRQRVIQLGEAPERVYNVGELALADLHKTPFTPVSDLEKLLGQSLKRFFLITVHPETCTPGAGLRIIEALFSIFSEVYPDYTLVFTGANADPEGKMINSTIMNYVSGRPGATFINSLGRLNYLSLARLAGCVIGNSSSGIAEVPALPAPVVNIGRRQLGRPHGKAVLSVPLDRQQIASAIATAIQPSFIAGISQADSPYEGEDAARKIAAVVTMLDLSQITREKGFCDL
ncbi:MAG TPA: UDP-N-acetylglucosamine 2-epimerase [Candidatus Rifleibacterium sp.]|nr:UDP-N-acetylglucosamine 2-epimerase [Candidatus Rifleibacterium sp.]HPT47531.1 UDP-N-acetylglucosamine 2-epimerase [Candidatus Rifleibacterium sp.]